MMTGVNLDRAPEDVLPGRISPSLSPEESKVQKLEFRN